MEYYKEEMHTFIIEELVKIAEEIIKREENNAKTK